MMLSDFFKPTTGKRRTQDSGRSIPSNHIPTHNGSQPVEFFVEKVLGKRFLGGRPQVLVQWVGFPRSETTWEPMDNMKDCAVHVANFETTLFAQSNGKQRGGVYRRFTVRFSERSNAKMSQAPGSSSKPTETWSAVEFVVEKICGKRFNCGRPELLVKWMGFPEQDNSWEPLENLGNCIQMVCDFEAELFTKTCGKSLTVAIPRDVLNLSPKPPMATRSTFMANAKTSKRKLESPKKRRQSSASSSISSQPAAKNSSSKSQTRSAPPLSVSLLNDLDLSEQSDDEVLVSTLQMLPPLKPPESDNLRNSVPVKESLEKERETSPRERNLSSSSSSSCLLSSTGSESDSTQTSKTSNTSNVSNTSMTRQASLAPPPTSKCLPPTEKSPSPTKLLPSSPKTEKAEGDLLSSLKMKARQWDRSNRVVKMGGFLEAGMFKPVNDVTNEAVKIEPPSPSIRAQKNAFLIPKEEPIGSTLMRVHGEPSKHVQWPKNLKNPMHRRMSYAMMKEEVASPDVSQTKNEVQKRRRVTIGPGNYKVKIEPPSPATPAMPVSTSRSIRINSSSGSSRRSPSRPAWKMSPSKKATVYGLKRGLPLDKVFHRFRVKDKTFLIVLWKGCSQPDAVLLDEIQDIYPLQVIQYFEGLKLRYDAL
ncbi:uncharacterized protein LOC6508048 isoform X2 [Drosophila ananassae]|uniref:uncharacterized protein LOC6508048 isoform X2 n=1 Tax=Drosophila ananassae TaxID=7217 RepID=UPI0013A5EAF0|nr:uncharacterized protein LOC6508048 isoform X2 [Drosophila ananassae]